MRYGAQMSRSRGSRRSRRRNNRLDSLAEFGLAKGSASEMISMIGAYTLWRIFWLGIGSMLLLLLENLGCISAAGWPEMLGFDLLLA